MTLRVYKHSLHRVILFITLFFIVFGSVTYSGYRLWRQYHATHGSRLTLSRGVITRSLDEPSETKPTEACGEYTAEADLPERISISEINVDGCIVQVSIDQHGTIATPDNIYLAGWYIKSDEPGRAGVSIINGYSSGKYATDAIFKRLGELKNGDAFTVTLGSGKALTYEVYKVQSVPADQILQLLTDQDSSVAVQLNLVTSSSNLSKASQQTIVSASLR